MMTVASPLLTATDTVPHSAPSLPCIELKGVALRYQTARGAIDALDDINLSIVEGEFVAFLGPTGCGKSSLLRLVSDLVAPTSGAIQVRGQPAAAARHANEFGFVFQEPALLSWRTALGNVHLPLEVVGYPAAKRLTRCEELLELRGTDPIQRQLSA